MADKSLKCAACGTAYTPEMKFCASCGARLGAPAAKAATTQAETAQGTTGPNQVMYACPTCSEPARYGSQFCIRCGAQFEWQSLLQETTPPPPRQEAEAVFVQQQPPPPTLPPQYAGNHISTRTHSWFVPFMAVMGVIVVAGIIALIVFSDVGGDIMRSFETAPVTTIANTPAPATPTAAAPATASPQATVPVSTEKQIVINYSGSTAVQIGGHIYPETGNTFLIVDMDIKNQGYEQFNLVPLNFEVTVNKTKYNTDISSSSDIAGVLQPLSLKNGMSTGGKLAFEVLATSFASDFKISYTGSTGYNIVWIRNQ
jgi:hypothetical protein